MRLTITILQSLIQFLKDNQIPHLEVDYQVMNFFDKSFPRKLLIHAYQVPIIYYVGDPNLISKINCIIIGQSPSFYVQKVVANLKTEYSVIGLESRLNSITKDLYLCDIIYCNDMSSLRLGRYKLKFTLSLSINNEKQLQLISLLTNKLFVLEGYLTPPTTSFITDCFDNGAEVYALPTNIFIKSGILPNVLIANGIIPLLSH